MIGIAVEDAQSVLLLVGVVNVWPGNMGDDTVGQHRRFASNISLSAIKRAKLKLALSPNSNNRTKCYVPRQVVPRQVVSPGRSIRIRIR